MDNTNATFDLKNFYNVGETITFTTSDLIAGWVIPTNSSITSTVTINGSDVNAENDIYTHIVKKEDVAELQFVHTVTSGVQTLSRNLSAQVKLILKIDDSNVFILGLDKLYENFNKVSILQQYKPLISTDYDEYFLSRVENAYIKSKITITTSSRLSTILELESTITPDIDVTEVDEDQYSVTISATEQFNYRGEAIEIKSYKKVMVYKDTDGDGFIDADEIHGCTETKAINFNLDATEDDGSCQYKD